MPEEPLVGGAGGKPVDLLSLEHFARRLVRGETRRMPIAWSAGAYEPPSALGVGENVEVGDEIGDPAVAAYITFR